MSSKRKIGLPPGSVIFTGDQRVEKVQLHHLKYNSIELQDYLLDNHSEIVLQESTEAIIDWYDIRGLHDTLLIESIGEAFDIHPLILEDIADTYQRPKFEEYDSGNFIIIRALSFNVKESKVSGIALWSSSSAAAHLVKTVWGLKSLKSNTGLYT